jgi:hypothetical protein
MAVPTHTDDWWPERETGILGHGHDGLVIDRIKHSNVVRMPTTDIVNCVKATLWALEQETEDLEVAAWLRSLCPPDDLP